MNYFDFYGLPMSVDLDKGQIKKVYFKKSRELHPDMHSNADSERLKRIEEESAINSKAYEVLSNFDSRLNHLLECLSEGPLESPTLSATFLMEMMEINESVEFMTDADKEELRADVINREAHLKAQLGDLVSQDLRSISEEELDSLKSYFFERKYLLRILENLDNLAAL